MPLFVPLDIGAQQHVIGVVVWAKLSAFSLSPLLHCLLILFGDKGSLHPKGCGLLFFIGCPSLWRRAPLLPFHTRAPCIRWHAFCLYTYKLFTQKPTTMLRWTIIFLVVAIIAAIFGFGGIAAGAAGIAKILFYIFLVLFVISLIAGRGRGVRDPL